MSLNLVVFLLHNSQTMEKLMEDCTASVMLDTKVLLLIANLYVNV